MITILKKKMSQIFLIKICFPIIFLLTLSSCNSQSNSNQSGSDTIDVPFDKIEDYLLMIQDEYGIPGIALAIIKDGKLIYKKNQGYANLEHEVPISNKSIFRLFSLTKPIIAIGVFQLIEKNKIKLEDKVDKYLKGLPKDWEGIQIKHLLTHSSGLPDMFGNYDETKDLTEAEAKKRVFALPINFKAGERFEYNQTNFWLIKEIIEIVSQLPLTDFIIKNQFSSSTKKEVLFSSDSRDIIKHRVTPYFPFAKGFLTADLPYTNGDYMFAAHSLNITLDEFINWDKKFMNNELISAASKQKMWKSFPYTNSADEFSYGWGVSYLNEKRGFGFSGSMSTIYRIYPDANLSIIFLTNGFTNRYDMGEVLIEFANLLEE